ncbi:MAG TPA: hydrogenase [Candidatus Acetothermia bacterium]|nr:hydrogenase [Candidatus Bipolaricaulota bacterium]RLE30019.1 MAG: hydrogenase [Candidatus Acetothermia bacterium]HDI11659.1 hydrogenase [Candidatus Acetothermia bacterium]
MSGIGSGEGFWNPIVWTLLALGVLGLAYALWLQGRRTYKRGTEQEEPFLSGERLPEEGSHIRGEHLYWGFVAGLRPLIETLRAFHTGFIGDYIGWLVVVLGVAILVVML